jgi:hypothetical protein
MPWQYEDDMKQLLTSLMASLFIFLLGTFTASAVSDGVTEQQTVTTNGEAVRHSMIGTENASTAIKQPEPITGAFGIPLGEHFETSLVARVLGKLEQSYRGQDGVELKGTLYRVEPNKPDARFQDYRIKTTEAGIIYAIEAYYEIEIKFDQASLNRTKPFGMVRSTCKDAVKALARELETRYGKPRGTGWDGDWFAFRQVTDSSDKSMRLYGNRCRTGLYSVVYTDEKLLHGLQHKSDAAAKINSATTGSSAAKP